MLESHVYDNLGLANLSVALSHAGMKKTPPRGHGGYSVYGLPLISIWIQLVPFLPPVTKKQTNKGGLSHFLST